MAERKLGLIELYMDDYTFRVHTPLTLSKEDRSSLRDLLLDATYDLVKSTDKDLEVMVGDYKKFIDILIKPLPEEPILAKVQKYYQAAGLKVTTSENAPSAGPHLGACYAP
jgi:hypothetical protein